MRPLAILAALLLTASPATAGAIVHVSAFWEITPIAAPEGVLFSCVGESFKSYSGGCGGSLSLFYTEDQGVQQNLRATSFGGLRLKNVSNPTRGPLAFRTAFSSFNSGGPQVGASVTNPDVEVASFASAMWGDLGMNDRHACSTAIPGYGTFSETSCGVWSPDFSTDMRGAFIPAIGASVDFMETISITASLFGIGDSPLALDAPSVFAARLAAPEVQTSEIAEISEIPEPATMPMFAAAFLAAFMWWQKRKVAA